MVNCHLHFDHSGGLPPFSTSGLNPDAEQRRHSLRDYNGRTQVFVGGGKAAAADQEFMQIGTGKKAADRHQVPVERQASVRNHQRRMGKLVGPRDQLFTGSRFAIDQNRCIRRSDLADFGVELFHLRGRADHAGERFGAALNFYRGGFFCLTQHTFYCC